LLFEPVMLNGVAVLHSPIRLGPRRSFKGDETGSLNSPKPVVCADQFIGMTFDPSTQDRLFFSKLSDWSYEREWRIVTALNARRQSPDGKLNLRDVDRHHLAGVIWAGEQARTTFHRFPVN
jgi:hypothetical protein